MKLKRMPLMLATLAAMLFAGVLAASAMPPLDAEPYDAPYLDTDPHGIAPYSTTWYRFEFVVDHPGFLCRFFACPDRAVYSGSAVIRLNDIARSGIRFEVYSPDRLADWRDSGPVGAGGQTGDDLVWAGESSTNGTWYVRVVNDRPYAIDYKFTVQGLRIALSRTPEPTATPWSVSRAIEAARGATPTPTTAGPPAGANTSPDAARPVDASVQLINSGADLWYMAAFPMNPDPVAFRLYDGARNGLAFDVYMPSQAGTWWKDDPLGRGSALGDDLVWAGTPDTIDRRLIRVVNRTGRAVSFTLAVQSTRPSAPPPAPFVIY